MRWRKHRVNLVFYSETCNMAEHVLRQLGIEMTWLSGLPSPNADHGACEHIHRTSQARKARRLGIENDLGAIGPQRRYKLLLMLQPGCIDDNASAGNLPAA